MKTTKEMTLCVPCAMKLGKTHRLKKVKEWADEKITCDECRRRRYGSTHEVTEK